MAAIRFSSLNQDLCPQLHPLMASSPRNSHRHRHVYESNGSDDWLVNHHRANFVRPVSSQPPFLFWTRRAARACGPGDDDDAEKLGGRKGFRVIFAELQRMKMRKLQIKLLRHIATMTKNGREPTKPERSQAPASCRGNGETSWTSWEDGLEAYSMKAADPFSHKS